MTDPDVLRLTFEVLIMLFAATIVASLIARRGRWALGFASGFVVGLILWLVIFVIEMVWFARWY